MVDQKYPVVIQPLAEDDGGGFMAYAPDLPGCVGDGETAEEAVTDLHKAILEWTDEALRTGLDTGLPATASGSWHFRRLWH